MSGIYGIYMQNGDFCDQELLQRMARSQETFRGDVSHFWTSSSIALGCTEWAFTGKCAVPYQVAGNPVWVIADARLDNRDELIATCTARQMPLSTKTDTELIGAAYMIWGNDCVHYLHGDVTFAIWDGSRRSLLCARSILSLRTMYYHCSAKRFLFASEIRQLFEDLSIERALDERWLSIWLTIGFDYWQCTPFRAIQELPPGHCLIIDSSHICVQSFWKPPLRQAIYASEQDYIAHFKDLLLQAVQTRVQADHFPCLFEISAGLDSTSIVSIAAQKGLIPEGSTLAHHFLPKYRELDTEKYIAAFEQMYGLSVTRLSYDNYPLFGHLTDQMPLCDTPVTQIFFSHVFHAQWQLARSHGAHGYLRGDFGDQLFLGNMAYLTTLWNERHYGQVASELRKWRQVGLSPFHLFQHHILCPLPQEKKIPAIPWISDNLYHLSQQVLEAERETLKDATIDPLTRQMLFLMAKYKEYASLQSAGILTTGLETRNPFADYRLANFILTTPAQYLIHPQSKFLLREAMRGILPEVVRTRMDKGCMSRALFTGIRRNHPFLRALIQHAPAIIHPFIDLKHLVSAVDRVSMGDDIYQSAFFGAIALVLWCHQQPWASGQLVSSSVAQRR